jgi:hypothetical protein
VGWLLVVGGRGDFVASFHHRRLHRTGGPTGRTNTGRERILRGLQREVTSFYRPESFHLRVLDAFGHDDHAAARYTIDAETALGPYSNHYAII